ncbi:MAG: hypothetical protein IJ688_10090 [Treponema sp.]|nr:hypothetical protein [Treponema sp.]
MKKILLLFFILSSALYAQTYKIIDSDISIQSSSFGLGTTTPYALKKNIPLDYKKEFTKNELELYLENYKQSLSNSRFFESIDVQYEEAEKDSDSEDDIINIIVIVNLKDSKHLLAVPYATFDQDINQTSINPKIKAKDTNFLGSMNPLSMDLNVEILKEENDSNWFITPGLNISYDYPFKLSPFDVTWVNDYELGFTFGENSPEWDAKTGLKFELPFEKISFIFEAYQHFYRDFDYEEYGDDLYFQEEFQFSTPVKIAKFNNYSDLRYTPLLNINWYWDSDSINKNNDELSSPQLTISHSLENSKINWNNNFRNGYYFSLSNSWMYNIQRLDLSPSIAFEGMFYKSLEIADRNFLDIIGVCTDLYAFIHFDLPDNSFYYGKKIGKRLRGIADESFFGNEKPNYTSSAALVWNLDLPLNIIRTSFKKDLINMNIQLSPFFDMAIYRDRSKNPEVNTALCSGLEVLVYPKKWSSFIIRGSLGFDLKSAFSEDNIIKGLLHNKEISFGLGLLY